METHDEEKESLNKFETSGIYTSIKRKTINTPANTLSAIRDSGEDVNTRSTRLETFLHLIAQAFERDTDAPYLLPVVYQLSNAGTDVNAVDVDGNSALHIAAKTTGSRKLIRALIMVGCDPNLRNADKQLPVQLAKNIPDNVAIIQTLSPGLWDAVVKRNKQQVEMSLANWGNVSQTKDCETLIERADRTGFDTVCSLLRASKLQNDFVHHCLAGDRQRMRELLRQHVSVNTSSLSFIDRTTGNYLPMPLVGECAMLGLDSVVRKLLRKSADMYVLLENEPLYLYIMKNIPPQKPFYQVIDTIGSKLEFFSRSRDAKEVLDAAYDKKLPVEVLRTLATSGLDIFSVDEVGHFLRDRILIKNIDKNPKKISAELTYVDNIVVDIAAFGSLDVLKSSYEHIDVVNQDGLTSRQALSEAKSETEATQFFEQAAETMKRHRNVCRVIDIGHLAQVQHLLTAEVIKMTDKGGRTLVHRAVMFERRHILRLLIKVCPERFTTTDKVGRSPLHLACLLQEGDDICDTLVAMGCKMDTRDENGKTPADIKVMTDSKKQALLDSERCADIGIDVYLYYRYLDIKEAIRAGDLRKVEEIRANMYQDISMEDIERRMYRTEEPQRGILEMAMDAERDVIVKFLLTSGMPWDITYKDGKEKITLLEAARRKEMKAVENYITFQIQQKEEQHAMINKIKNKGVVKKR